jgi:hypothetical protein
MYRLPGLNSPILQATPTGPMARTVPGPVYQSAIRQLPVQFQRLINAVWNDKGAISILLELWDKARRNRLSREPGSPPLPPDFEGRFIISDAAFDELVQRFNQLPPVPGERYG